ncbi:substrate-binding domain-containing protein [Marinobacter zhejiangensis]|uniref:Phosphate ABC transporter substrate-binding protein, PhoT family (TC 3.A.1.7.1) n=1 Tax=Marinobacter zhejiangensis TaxID=488535 RepID=A0A1I4L7A7_9GAMM|nr:substrate-binding domain-containing protein [Marinobacter zhejiangensis]SFL86870.1 phosphate ABC transporter substrate-binding protein, PhoT family (TC 3.A.1.7.1) [Marinobacter zhejiangensis]
MIKLKTAFASLAVAGTLAAVSTPTLARDTINIVGSSTVYPFATVVAEHFGRDTDFPTPKLESTGSGGGLKLFCAGIGTQHPDITNASRRMKASEFELCQTNGVEEIVEVQIGSDGIVLASSQEAENLNVSLQQLFLALAKEVPNPNGSEELVANPYNNWSDIDASLPNTAIRVMGPPPTSGTRDAFNELALEGGCKTFSWIKAIKDEDKNAYKAICHSVREDGAFVEAGENDNLIVQKLTADHSAYGIFGYSFLEENSGTLQAATVAGFEPTMDNISAGDYPLARSLWFYVKKAHVGVVPGIAEYVAEFASEGAWGDNGYLADVGLIPLDRADRMAAAERAAALETMTGDEL